jgi:hypothetical protein
MNTIPFYKVLSSSAPNDSDFFRMLQCMTCPKGLFMKENKIGDERADWVVPGSKHTVCAWLKTHRLCLAQNTPFVPGSKHTVCAWLKTHRLCLAQNTDACKKPDNVRVDTIGFLISINLSGFDSEKLFDFCEDA